MHVGARGRRRAQARPVGHRPAARGSRAATGSSAASTNGASSARRSTPTASRSSPTGSISPARCSSSRRRPRRPRRGRASIRSSTARKAASTSTYRRSPGPGCPTTSLEKVPVDLGARAAPRQGDPLPRRHEERRPVRSAAGGENRLPRRRHVGRVPGTAHGRPGEDGLVLVRGKIGTGATIDRTWSFRATPAGSDREDDHRPGGRLDSVLHRRIRHLLRRARRHRRPRADGEGDDRRRRGAAEGRARRADALDEVSTRATTRARSRGSSCTSSETSPPSPTARKDARPGRVEVSAVDSRAWRLHGRKREAAALVPRARAREDVDRRGIDRRVPCSTGSASTTATTATPASRSSACVRSAGCSRASGATTRFGPRGTGGTSGASMR